jgi:hypothetical protein
VTERSLLLDTNLLLLFIVGSASREYISRHRRLRAYSESDFDLLVNLVSSARRVLITPNTLTETSNLAAYISEPARTHVYEVFRAVVRSTEEEYWESKGAVERSEFLRLGLTDSVLLDATTASHSLLTVDLDLYLAVISRGGLAVNFNHLREV